MVVVEDNRARQSELERHLEELLDRFEIRRRIDICSLIALGFYP